MTYAVRTRLAVAEMPQPEGNCWGLGKRRKPIPSRGCYFNERQHRPLVDVANTADPRYRQPLRRATLLQVVHCFPELSTESLHSPVTRLSPGFDAELPCALGDRDRWPM